VGYFNGYPAYKLVHFTGMCFTVRGRPQDSDVGRLSSR